MMLIARIADAIAPFGCVESVVEILGKRGWDHFECETLQYCKGTVFVKAKCSGEMTMKTRRPTRKDREDDI